MKLVRIEEFSYQNFNYRCSEILRKYPNYEVEYKGIGEGPKGTERLGCCSQMAIFRKISDEETINDVCWTFIDLSNRCDSPAGNYNYCITVID